MSVTVRVTRITFLPHPDEQFKLEPKCIELVSCDWLIQ